MPAVLAAPAVTKPTTWPLFRFAQRAFGGRWLLVDACSDEALVTRGFTLGSPWRNADALDMPEQDELFSLSSRGKRELTPEQTVRELELLARCPFLGPMPPYDFDVAPDTDPNLVLETALRFVETAHNHGWGTPTLYSTGGKGLHGDHESDLESPHLLMAYWEGAKHIAELSGIPLLSAHRPKAGRPPVVLDDTLFDRRPESRGVMWRLRGAVRDDTGKVKTPIADGYDPEPAEPEVVMAAIARAAQGYVGIESYKEREKKARPQPIVLGKEPLVILGAVLSKHLPPTGRRHDFRLCVAGWLLKRGLPAHAVVRELVNAGDTQDAMDAVMTTEQRIAADLPVTGLKRMRDLVGRIAADELEAAYSQELARLGADFADLSRYLNVGERDTLMVAANLAKSQNNQKSYNALKRAADCGKRGNRADCTGCGSKVSSSRMVAETLACPHCATNFERALKDWIRLRWPDMIAVGVKRLPDAKRATSNAALKEAKRATGREAWPHIRWVKAPGYIVAISADPKALIFFGMHFSGTGSNAHSEWVTRDQAIEFLLPVLMARAKLIRTQVALQDIEGLAANDWILGGLITHGGRKAARMLPWLNRGELRLAVKNAARAKKGLPPLGTLAECQEADRLSPCCGDKKLYTLFDDEGDIATRDDRPWQFDEGVWRAAFLDPNSDDPWRRRGGVHITEINGVHVMLPRALE